MLNQAVIPDQLNLDDKKCHHYHSYMVGKKEDNCENRPGPYIENYWIFFG